MQMPMSQNDFEVMQEAVDMLRELEDFGQFREMTDIVSRLQDKLSITRHNRKPIIHFDSMPDLKGCSYLIHCIIIYCIDRHCVLCISLFLQSIPSNFCFIRIC